MPFTEREFVEFPVYFPTIVKELIFSIFYYLPITKILKENNNEIGGGQ